MLCTLSNFFWEDQSILTNASELPSYPVTEFPIDTPVQGLAGSSGDFPGRLAGVPWAERGAGGPGSQAGHPPAPPHRHSPPYVLLTLLRLAPPPRLTLLPRHTSRAATVSVRPPSG